MTTSIPTAEGMLGLSEGMTEERLNELFAQKIAHLTEPWMPAIGFLDFVNQPHLALAYAPDDDFRIDRYNGRWQVRRGERFCQSERLGYAVVVTLLRDAGVKL